MRYEPHDYQVYAAEYIKQHDVAAVLLECGLGKTSITLTAINDLMFDSFDIRKERTDKEFRKEMREFLTIDYAEACNYCDHDKKIAIPAGEQLP